MGCAISLLLPLLLVCLIDWISMYEQMKSGTFILPCSCFLFCFVFDIKLNSRTWILSQSTRIESNQIESNRFIWMNGIVELCRWHYQIHRIQLKIYFCVLTANACIHVCMVQYWIHQNQNALLLLCMLWVCRWCSNFWELYRVQCCDITVNIDSIRWWNATQSLRIYV